MASRFVSAKIITHRGDPIWTPPGTELSENVLKKLSDANQENSNQPSIFYSANEMGKPPNRVAPPTLKDIELLHKEIEQSRGILAEKHAGQHTGSISVLNTKKKEDSFVVGRMQQHTFSQPERSRGGMFSDNTGERKTSPLQIKWKRGSELHSPVGSLVDTLYLPVARRDLISGREHARNGVDITGRDTQITQLTQEIQQLTSELKIREQQRLENALAINQLTETLENLQSNYDHTTHKTLSHFKNYEHITLEELKAFFNSKGRPNLEETYKKMTDKITKNKQDLKANMNLLNKMKELKEKTDEYNYFLRDKENSKDHPSGFMLVRRLGVANKTSEDIKEMYEKIKNNELYNSLTTEKIMESIKEMRDDVYASRKRRKTAITSPQAVALLTSKFSSDYTDDDEDTDDADASDSDSNC